MGAIEIQIMNIHTINWNNYFPAQVSHNRSLIFWPAGSVHFWEKIADASNYNSEFIYFSLQLYQFLTHVTFC